MAELSTESQFLINAFLMKKLTPIATVAAILGGLVGWTLKGQANIAVAEEREKFFTFVKETREDVSETKYQAQLAAEVVRARLNNIIEEAKSLEKKIKTAKPVINSAATLTKDIASKLYSQIIADPDFKDLIESRLSAVSAFVYGTVDGEGGKQKLNEGSEGWDIERISAGRYKVKFTGPRSFTSTPIVTVSAFSDSPKDDFIRVIESTPDHFVVSILDLTGNADQTQDQDSKFSFFAIGDLEGTPSKDLK